MELRTPFDKPFDRLRRHLRTRLRYTALPFDTFGQGAAQDGEFHYQLIISQ
jgi:hypothetical protein